MKQAVLAFVLFLTTQVYASSQTETFTYDGSQDSVELALRTEQTRTEYRVEQRDTMCVRMEQDVNVVCSGYPPTCFPQYTQRPVYYPCQQTVNVPYEVKEFDVEAKVKIDVEKLEGAFTTGEKIDVTLDGDQLSLTATGSGKYFVLKSSENFKTATNGSVKFIDAQFTLALVEASPVLQSFTMTQISLYDSQLKFVLGPVVRPELIGFSLNIEKKPVVGLGETVLARELTSSEYVLSGDQTKSEVSVDLPKLGVKLGSGRYLLTSKVFLKNADKVLNKSQFKNLEASRTLVYKVR